MQEEKFPIANTVRTERTITSLKQAAMALFRKNGYADTSTQQIVKHAAVTRGALYHHFTDKRDLFEAIIADELASIAKAIVDKGATVNSAVSALKQGGQAFVREFEKNDRTRLILIEAPAVLGRKRLVELEDATTRRTLVEGLQSAMKAGEIQELPLQATVELFSAAFDTAALHIDAGHSRNDMIEVIDALIDGLARDVN